MGVYRMKVGTSLVITIYSKQNKETDTYHCKIVDITNSHLVIDYPLSLQINRPIPIRESSDLQIEFMEKGSVYQFNSVVTKLVQSPFPAFLIPLPKMKQMNKVQRREYVRIEYATDVAIHGLNDNFQPFTTVTKDISGGGIAIILPHDATLEGIEEIEVFLVLKSTYSDFEYIHTRARVIRTMSMNGVRVASVKFLITNEQKRQKIIKYCFEIQREQLKQQLL